MRNAKEWNSLPASESRAFQSKSDQALSEFACNTFDLRHVWARSKALKIPVKKTYFSIKSAELPVIRLDRFAIDSIAPYNNYAHAEECNTYWSPMGALTHIRTCLKVWRAGIVSASFHWPQNVGLFICGYLYTMSVVVKLYSRHSVG